MKQQILIIDDQESILFFLQKTLEEEGYAVTTAANAKDAWELLEDTAPELILLDLKLPDANGMDVLRRICKNLPDTRTVIMTAFGDTDAPTEAIRLGAFDYVHKPISLDKLLKIVHSALSEHDVMKLVEAVHQEEDELFHHSEGIIPSTSAKMLRIYDLIRRISVSDSSTVLITGESGVGKDVISNLIHQNSRRSDHAFLEIDCASLPEQLLESELFGHEKGAFTDAIHHKMGLLELANRGTLFLDEIGEMSITIQAKLLRVLEKMTFRRVGGIKDIKVNVRVIAATNRDLRRCVEDGLFREDLYYRLNVLPISVPPLRNRLEDIAPLAEHFLLNFSQAFGKSFQGISPEAQYALMQHNWRGNIRELKNLMERIALLEDDQYLHLEHLHFDTDSNNDTEEAVIRKIEGAINTSFPPEGVDFEGILEELGRSLIEKAFKAADGNQSQTAKLLQMNRDKLRYRMKNYQLL